MPSSRGSSWSRNQNWVSCITGRFFTIWATVALMENLTKNLAKNVTYFLNVMCKMSKQKKPLETVMWYKKEDNIFISWNCLFPIWCTEQLKTESKTEDRLFEVRWPNCESTLTELYKWEENLSKCHHLFFLLLYKIIKSSEVKIVIKKKGLLGKL